MFKEGCSKEAISAPAETAPRVARCVMELCAWQWLKRGQVGERLSPNLLNLLRKRAVTALLRHVCTLRTQANPVARFALCGKLSPFCPILIFISNSVYDFNCILLGLGLS